MSRIGLQLAPGIVSDETTYSTPGSFADGNNVRFWKGRPQSDAGYTAYHVTPLTGVCRSALAWSDALGQTNIAFGTHSALMLIKAGVLYDITPAGLAAGETDTVYYPGGWGTGGWGLGGWGIGQTLAPARTWSLANYGQALIASPSGGAIYIWENDPSSVATVISQAPSFCSRVLVTNTRQVCAIGTTEEISTVYNPMCVRFSDIDEQQRQRGNP
jgi:hypothetical protein